MRGESRVLANTLLERHRLICRPLHRREPDDVDKDDIDACIMSYSDLCELAGLGRHFARASKNFLYEIVEWCVENNWPPLNAPAVKAAYLYPGDRYTKAPGCHDWPTDVRRVIAFVGYPTQC
jgi:hypothetical protein